MVWGMCLYVLAQTKQHSSGFIIFKHGSICLFPNINPSFVSCLLTSHFPYSSQYHPCMISYVVGNNWVRSRTFPGLIGSQSCGNCGLITIAPEREGREGRRDGEGAERSSGVGQDQSPWRSLSGTGVTVTRRTCDDRNILQSKNTTQSGPLCRMYVLIS